MHHLLSTRIKNAYSIYSTSWRDLKRPQRRLFCFGVGYVGLALAHYLKPLGWEFAGTCTSVEKAKWLRTRGISAYVFDGHSISRDVQTQLQKSPYILVTIAPLPHPLFDAHSAYLLKHSEWIGYLSSTSVYGDWKGEWVDERSETRTKSRRGQGRLLGEREWLDLLQKASVPVHIFRLGGVYGPDRSILQSITANQNTTLFSKRRRAAQQFINRCHVHDICQVIAKSMEHPSPGEVYNVVDDEPTSRSLAEELAIQLTNEFGTDHLARESYIYSKAHSEKIPSQKSDAVIEEKRVLNQKIKEELGIELMFPSISVGLQALVTGDDRPFNTI